MSHLGLIILVELDHKYKKFHQHFTFHDKSKKARQILPGLST